MRIMTQDTTSETRNSSRRSGRGSDDGIGRGVDGTFVGRYGGDAMVFSIFRLGVVCLGVASRSISLDFSFEGREAG